MAEQDVSEKSEAAEARGGSLLGAVTGAIGAAVTSAASIVAVMWDAATSDGILAASARQGFDELGKALEAFPQSIHSDEIGTIFNPTQGEVASARAGEHGGGLFHSSFYASYSHAAGPPETWPSEMAKNSQSNDAGQDLGQSQDQGHSM